MIRPALLASLLALSIPMGAAIAQGVPAQAITGTRLDLVATGEVSRVPDIARINAGVVTLIRNDQIADVMADESVMFAPEAESVLQLRAARENLPPELERSCERRGRVAARAPQHHLASRLDARHGVVRAHVYAPVVAQKIIGDGAQALFRLCVFITDRLV